MDTAPMDTETEKPAPKPVDELLERALEYLRLGNQAPAARRLIGR